MSGDCMCCKRWNFRLYRSATGDDLCACCHMYVGVVLAAAYVSERHHGGV